MITITTEQIKNAQKEIREWFPGTTNKDLRSTLRAQLAEQVSMINGQDPDSTNGYELRSCKVKLGYGILFLNGSGDQRAQNFNEDVNKALGLLQ